MIKFQKGKNLNQFEKLEIGNCLFLGACSLELV